MKKFQNFKEFYSFYLNEHTNSVCRTLHFIGTCFVIALLLVTSILQEYRILLICPIIGYSFAWVGHFYYEKNKPATFIYPLYSFIGDFVMFWQLLTGKLQF